MGDSDCWRPRLALSPVANYLSNLKFSLTCRLNRNLLSPNDIAFREWVGRFAILSAVHFGLEETASHAFYHYLQVHPFWDYVSEQNVLIDRENLVFIDHAYACDNVLSPYSGVKGMMCLTC